MVHGRHGELQARQFYDTELHLKLLFDQGSLCYAEYPRKPIMMVSNRQHGESD
jgi:hypothetical protein